jgi:hypothetical protein
MNLSRILSASLVGLCLVLGGCGGGMVPFTGMQQFVSADGEAKWEEIAGGAILVEIEMTNLPPPGRIAQGYTTYVVWFAPTGRNPVVASTLEYDEEDRTGSTSATNATKTFDVLITAERNAQVSMPSQYNVARFRVDAR